MRWDVEEDMDCYFLRVPARGVCLLRGLEVYGGYVFVAGSEVNVFSVKGVRFSFEVCSVRPVRTYPVWGGRWDNNLCFERK